ncbi:MAG: glycosyltransferase [Methanobacteriota archaeon]
MRYSVVIPALNEEENIVACITEVKKQAPSAEIIVVDGESTDNTAGIAERLGAVVIVEKKKTIAAARDTGLRTATGDIVCYVDADVVPAELWFERIVHPFSHPKVVGVAGIAIPHDGTWFESFGMAAVLGVLAGMLFKVGIPMVTGQNMAFRRKEALEAGGFLVDQITGEDTSMFLRIKEEGKIVHSFSCVRVSMRRIRRWGLLKYVVFNTRNFFHLLKYKQPIQDEYEPVRD